MLVRPSLRQYATRAVLASKPTAPPPAPAPSPVRQPAVSLQARILQSSMRNHARLQGTWDESRNAMKNHADEFTEGMSPEEQMEALAAHHEAQRQHFKNMGRTQPPAPQLPLMDLMIPYSVGFKADAYRQLKRNILNAGKNAFSMRHIAMADSFPGVEVDRNMGWARSLYMMARRLFQTQSLKSDTWVAPMRQEFLAQYIKLNQALLNKNRPHLLALTMKPYTDEVLALLEKNDALYRRWHFHREVTPTRILSLRAADGHFGKEMPSTGSRIAIQALSLEIYDREGRALHTPAPTAAPQPPRLGKKLHIVPAVPKRVTEYLVLDKMFYVQQGRWRFRARLVPEPGKTVAV
ncbi:hypothetical protein C8F04DRAFT_1260638 [Mycena alexandri]|uniref:Tim44-like domain-containing protein n=1 Tax=Mycena alexandri TaxID=1745969 RepID=A0AAD6STJ9_9AGAR|nr:hypothetical protein C8F04DRAFT_1260638 [Mycena alexandri]